MSKNEVVNPLAIQPPKLWTERAKALAVLLITTLLVLSVSHKYDITVKVKDNWLTVSGKHEVGADDQDNYFSESASFENSYTLPSDAVSSDITAICKNGVLEVTIPKHKNGSDAVEIKVKCCGS